MSREPKGQGKEAKENQPPKRLPMIIRIIRALKRYENRCRRRRYSQHQHNELMMAQWTRHVGRFTGALVVVGVITAVIFWRQLDVMQGQLKEMHADGRPWVGVGAVLFTEFPNAFMVRFTNSGKSPALKVRVDVRAVSEDIGRVEAIISACTDTCLIKDYELLPG